MTKIKLKWKVDEVTSGRYSCFQKREMPTAIMKHNDELVAQIVCEEINDYVSYKDLEGRTMKIRFWVKEKNEHGKEIKVRKISKETFTSVKELKACAEKIINGICGLNDDISTN